MNNSSAQQKSIRPARTYNLARQLDYLIRQYLWAQILVAMFLGVALGLGMSPSGGAWVATNTANTLADWFAVPGEIFLALIAMIVVPLVLSSIVLGITGGGNVDFLRKLGSRIAPYFLSTTCVAVFIGVLLANWIVPGDFVDLANVSGAAELPVQPDIQATDTRTIPEKIVAIIPSNPSSAILQRSMFQIVVLSILLAVALISIKPERSKPILDLCVSLQEVSMKVVSWAMALAPIAVFGLLVRVCVDLGLDALFGMAVYIGTVLLGLLLLLVFYLCLAFLFAGQAPLEFLRKIREVQLLAFSTSSSAAVMPLSMKTATDKLHVRPAIAQFIVPLGATVNMDGTALYQIVAALFLTQVYGIDLSTGAVVLLAATTVGASIGSPSTPGVGIVILATIVQGIGVPPSGVALIIGVDRILDMSRTAINVTGDLTACVIMNRWIKTGSDEAHSDAKLARSV